MGVKMFAHYFLLSGKTVAKLPFKIKGIATTSISVSSTMGGMHV